MMNHLDLPNLGLNYLVVPELLFLVVAMTLDYLVHLEVRLRYYL
jgi:hypothetical protein